VHDRRSADRSQKILTFSRHYTGPPMALCGILHVLAATAGFKIDPK